MKATLCFWTLFCVSSLGLNVHLVGHTHDDVGWLKTVDQYYYGGNQSIQHAGVQYIINAIIPALEANPDRKFSYVEQAFFQRWWREQPTSMQNRVKTLVTNGQLELLNGGWCMHDEANPHYVGMLDHTTLGHKFIKDEFNYVPTAGWQIDPFGHSSTQAALLSAEVGFESLWTARIDYQDHNQRMNDKTLEMIWRGSPSYGSSADVFFGAFVGHYSPPSGLCFDIRCGDAPIQDNPNLEDYNVPDRVNNFVTQANSYAQHIQGNDIMFTLGDDFEWEAANNWFINLDKLIKYVNADGRVKTFYSTPTMYGRAKIQSSITWPLKTDDFFPYSDGSTSVWSGYFTSRAALKRQVRVSDSLNNVFKQIESLGLGDGSNTQQFAEAAGVTQHHDAVAGTSKQHVAYDYARGLSAGANKASTYANTVLKKWLNDNNLNLTWCPALNESVCSVSQNNRGVGIIIYNPTARARSELIRIPINNNSVALFNYKGDAVTSQIVANPTSPVVQTSPPSPYSLYFIAALPALGYTTYFIQPTTFESRTTLTSYQEPEPFADTVIQNSAVALTFDGTTGLLKQVQDKASGLTRNISQNFYYWQSADSTGGNPSGAYIFRNRTATETEIATTATIKVVTGSVINEVQQSFSTYITQSVRLVGDQRQVEFHYSVGSIPISDSIGKEIITHYNSEIASGKTWYTDSNGREFLTRVKDYRPTWTYKVDQPIAGNYYPVNMGIYLKDTAAQMTVLNDRSQGGTSLNPGQIELMVHRRILHDDGRGVGEPLNETQGISTNGDRIGAGMGISGTHYLLLTTPSTAAANFRPLADRVFSEPYLVFTPVTNMASFVSSHNTQRSFIGTELPINVQLLTLHPWNSAGSMLVRLSHQFAVNEDAKYSAPVTVDLATVINWQITNATELSLTGNQNKASMKRPQYRVKDDDQNPGRRGDATQIITENGQVKAVIVSLGPMEIKTFHVTATFN